MKHLVAYRELVDETDELAERLREQLSNGYLHGAATTAARISDNLGALELADRLDTSCDRVHTLRGHQR